MKYPDESHQKERSLKAVQVWNCTVKNDLKKLFNTTYINKMCLLFYSTSLNNSTVKRVWLGVIMGWVALWKFSQKMLSEDKAH